MTKLTCGVGCILLLFAVSAVGQNPLGTVENVVSLPACPSGYFQGMRCFQATVSCPGTVDLPVTFGYENPNGTPLGTIFTHSGGGGTLPYNGGLGTTTDYMDSYLNAGYQVVQMAWLSPWEDVGAGFAASIATAACRPATLMQYIYQNVRTSGAMCAQGASGGSAAIAYALAWYNASSYLDKAELISGPVFGNIEEGCVVPKSLPVTVCPSGQFGCVGASWQDAPQYVQGAIGLVRTWTGNNSCQGSRRTSRSSNDNWLAMSVVSGSPDVSFFYPKTAMAGWLCSNGQNNSAAEGQYYYTNFTDSSQTAAYSVTRIDECHGPEIIEPGKTPSGEDGFTAVVNDMTDANLGCVLRH
jgi:hypothetical protein